VKRLTDRMAVRDPNFELKVTVPNWSETPIKSRVNKFGAGWSKRQYGNATLGSSACNSRSRSSR
jgi:hypothetical protein